MKRTQVECDSWSCTFQLFMISAPFVKNYILYIERKLAQNLQNTKKDSVPTVGFRKTKNHHKSLAQNFIKAIHKPYKISPLRLLTKKCYIIQRETSPKPNALLSCRFRGNNFALCQTFDEALLIINFIEIRIIPTF